jgi:hypothetical protein
MSLAEIVETHEFLDEVDAAETRLYEKAKAERGR